MPLWILSSGYWLGGFNQLLWWKNPIVTLFAVDLSRALGKVPWNKKIVLSILKVGFWCSWNWRTAALGFLTSVRLLFRSLAGPLVIGLVWVSVVGTVIALDKTEDGLWTYFCFLIFFVMVGIRLNWPDLYLSINVYILNYLVEF